MSRTLLVLLLAAPTLASAPLPFPRPDPARDDLAGMQGRWELAFAYRRVGREEAGGRCEWAFTGDRLDTTLNGAKGSTCFITLGGGPPPRPFDIRHARAAKEFAPGRYRLDGDRLFVSTGEKRPRDLSGHGRSECVWVFRRVRP